MILAWGGVWGGEEASGTPRLTQVTQPESQGHAGRGDLPAQGRGHFETLAGRPGGDGQCSLRVYCPNWSHASIFRKPVSPRVSGIFQV